VNAVRAGTLPAIARPGLILAGLAAAVVCRTAAAAGYPSDGLATGLAFGAALLLLAGLGAAPAWNRPRLRASIGARMRRGGPSAAVGARTWHRGPSAEIGPRIRQRGPSATSLRADVPAGSIVLGLAAGGLLVGVALAAPAHRIVTLGPHIQFLPWTAITLVVATAEELVLRGVLFDALTGTLGVTAAIGITSVAFALLHVPLYGWQVVPLDLGVGLVLAGLRLVSGSVAAPAIAHALADLATWWL